ncbi:glycosyltransferase [Streptomyces sediminimaris]|uniref:glycosyltransferase n=1 Tax=Streptomyces sediminimaris TaxID=3383721 RepID=UPI00399C0DBE
MRILFSATPAHGHILPLLPLARAFRARNDEVALLTSGGLASAFSGEDVEVLAAGPELGELMGEVIARTGADPLAGLTPEQEAEAFAGVRVDLTADVAEDVVRGWRPDVIISEHYDFVGPLLGALLGVPVAVLAFGPAIAPDSAALMASTVRSRWSARGVQVKAPDWYLDTCPPALQIDEWQRPRRHMALRPEPHRNPGSPSRVVASRVHVPEDSARVLVTFGTIFSSPQVLGPILSELGDAGWEVRATTGLVSTAAEYGVDQDRVTLVEFTPLDELLADIDVAVIHGGAGSTLGLLSAGIPLVVVPLGADHQIQADRVTAAGAGVTVSSGANGPDIAKLVAHVLGDASYRAGAQRVAAEIAALPSPDDIAARLRVEVGTWNN